MAEQDARSIAQTIAEYLGPRDDIAEAVVLEEAVDRVPTIDVQTQAGERFFVMVAPA